MNVVIMGYRVGMFLPYGGNFRKFPRKLPSGRNVFLPSKMEEIKETQIFISRPFDSVSNKIIMPISTNTAKLLIQKYHAGVILVEPAQFVACISVCSINLSTSTIFREYS